MMNIPEFLFEIALDADKYMAVCAPSSAFFVASASFYREWPYGAILLYVLTLIETVHTKCEMQQIESRI